MRVQRRNLFRRTDLRSAKPRLRQHPPDSNRDGDPNRHSNRNRHSDADRDSDQHSDGNADGHAYGDRDQYPRTGRRPLHRSGRLHFGQLRRRHLLQRTVQRKHAALRPPRQRRHLRRPTGRGAGIVRDRNGSRSTRPGHSRRTGATTAPGSQTLPDVPVAEALHTSTGAVATELQRWTVDVTASDVDDMRCVA